MGTEASDWDALSPVLDACAEALERLGGQGWLVGGCVRDALLGRAPGDVDLAITSDPARLAHVLTQTGAIAVDIGQLAGAHGTVRLTPQGAGAQPRWQVDLAPLRGGSIIADLEARDFTINALALPLAERAALRNWAGPAAPAGGLWAAAAALLVDPCGGVGDARARRLRVASAHALSDDPLRVLRGARQAAALDLIPEAATVERARAASALLLSVASARIGEELRGMLVLPAPARGLEHLRAFGGLAVLLPELRGAQLNHALATLGMVDAAQTAILRCVPARGGMRSVARAQLDAWYAQPLAAGRTRGVAVRWAALLHDLKAPEGPDDPDEIATAPATSALAAVAARLGMAQREQRLVRDVAARQRAAWALSDEVGAGGRISGAAWLRAARRWFARGGDAGVEALVVAVACGLADIQADSPAHSPEQTSALGRQSAHLLSRFLGQHDQVVPAPLLDGQTLMREVGVVPGPELGRLLSRVRAAQLDGAVATPAQALRLARALRATHG